MIDHQALVAEAIEARKKAYSPYSNYAVGAALLTADGQVFTGCNIENAVYPVSICAERTAIFKAISEGKHEFSAIAVVTRDAGSPCGSCRQVMAEFGLETVVIIANQDGKITRTLTVGELLPDSFGPQNLQS